MAQNILPELNNILGTTWDQKQEARRASELDQLFKKSQTNFNEATAAQTRFNTRKGEAMLPIDVEKGQLDNEELRIKTKTALANMNDADATRAMVYTIKQQQGILSVAQSSLESGQSVEDMIQTVLGSIPEKARSDPKVLRALESYKNKDPQTVMEEIQKALTGTNDIIAKLADSPGMAKQILMGSQQLEQTKEQNKGALERAHVTGRYGLTGDQLRAEATKAGDNIPKTDAQMRQKYIDEKRVAEKGIAMYEDWVRKNPGKRMTQSQWEDYQGLRTQLERANAQLDPILNKTIVNKGQFGLDDQVSVQTKGSGNQGVNVSKIPPAKVMLLQQNNTPQMRKLFDEAFGEGAATAVLGK